MISEAGAETCLIEAAKALTAGGTLALYGPFLRNGRATSDGDARFDADLRGRDASIGYKDIGWVIERLKIAGMAAPQVINMPANNLMIFAQKL